MDNFRSVFDFLGRFWWVLLLIFQLKVNDATQSTPPNVIIVLTDDQDIVLNGMVSAVVWLCGEITAGFSRFFGESSPSKLEPPMDHCFRMSDAIPLELSTFLPIPYSMI